MNAALLYGISILGTILAFSVLLKAKRDLDELPPKKVALFALGVAMVFGSTCFVLGYRARTNGDFRIQFLHAPMFQNSDFEDGEIVSSPIIVDGMEIAAVRLFPFFSGDNELPVVIALIGAATDRPPHCVFAPGDPVEVQKIQKSKTLRAEWAVVSFPPAD